MAEESADVYATIANVQAFATAVAWAGLIAFFARPSPFPARVVSILAIGAAYHVCIPSATTAYRWPIWAMCEAPLQALFLRFGDAKAIPAARLLPWPVVFAARLGLEILVCCTVARGSLASPEVRLPLNAVAMLAVGYGGISPFAKTVKSKGRVPLSAVDRTAVLYSIESSFRQHTTYTAFYTA